MLFCWVAAPVSGIRPPSMLITTSQSAAAAAHSDLPLTPLIKGGQRLPGEHP